MHWRVCHFWGRFCHHFYAGSEIHTHETVSFSSYSVGAPTFQDTIQKEFVFKLSFKNHVYFFRADSEHTYNRWMEVLKSTTQTQDFKNTRTAHWLTDKKISKISWCLKYFYLSFEAVYRSLLFIVLFVIWTKSEIRSYSIGHIFLINWIFSIIFFYQASLMAAYIFGQNSPSEFFVEIFFSVKIYMDFWCNCIRQRILPWFEEINIGNQIF